MCLLFRLKTSIFLGQTTVSFRIKDNNNEQVDYDDSMPVTVIREKRAIDSVFTGSVATLVSIIYINFGCALHWEELRKSLKRPVGPVIGLATQFGIMPTVSVI